MNNIAYTDSIGWDTVNWSKGLKYIENKIDFRNKKVLELGCGGQNGGLSLWSALLGAKKVLCTNYGNITILTQKKHANYNLSNIEYGSINALNIPYNNEFDIVCFKSMAGGITLYEAKNTEIILQNCAKALKKDGYLVFLENLSSTSFHMLCRRKLIKCSWHYYTINELEQESKRSINHVFLEIFCLFKTKM